MMNLGWIDFSPSHRNKIGAALDLLRPEGMVDELGMATLRDALADELFPGIGTVQTRARYFFIVPYILHEYQQLVDAGGARGKSASKYLYDREHEVMWALVEKYQNLQAEDAPLEQGSPGVIGIRRPKPRRIVRRPSAIYWNGIGYYNFMKTGHLPMEVFLKKAKKGEFETLMSKVADADDVTDDADADYENLFHIKVTYLPGWDEELSLDLTSDEADYFHHCILSHAKGRLIAEILKNDKLGAEFYPTESFMDFAKKAVSLISDENLGEQLIIAHDFSELMFGAHLAYNCIVRKQVFNDDELENDWQDWRASLPISMIRYQHLDLDKLFSYSSRTRNVTVKFVREWWDLVQQPKVDLEVRNRLIVNQEFNVKRSKARLRAGKFDDVQKGSWIGLSYLSYRYRNAKRILNDIQSKL